MVDLIFKTDRDLNIIDCREMFPPEPMEQVLTAVESLSGNDAILMVHRKDPVPLYEKLKERNCQYETKISDDGEVHVLVWKTE